MNYKPFSGEVAKLTIKQKIKKKILKLQMPDMIPVALAYTVDFNDYYFQFI